jgi:2-phospho-L-lactate guanylyltransferase
LGERSPDVHDRVGIRDDVVLMTLTTPVPWQVVVPVKGTDGAKTRLGVAPSEHRLSLARAFALDTLEAVANALRPRPGSRLVVVSADTAEGSWPVADLVVPDPGRGLNPAIELGLAACEEDAFRAVLLGDLPSLTAADLNRALDAAEPLARGLVPDADGRGSVLVTAAPGIRLVPSFGRDSARAHADAGFADLHVQLPRLRADVDDLADLDAALVLGVGAHTRRALGAHT